jgi:hypothetical protein
VSVQSAGSRLGELLAEQTHELQRRAYRQGLAHGTLMTIDHIEGRPDVPGVPYDGPLPAELREYLARSRARVEEAA